MISKMEPVGSGQSLKYNIFMILFKEILRKYCKTFRKYCVNMVWARDRGTVQRPGMRVFIIVISSFVECHFGIKRIKSITYRSKCIFSTLFLGDTKFFWHLFLKALSKFWRIIISNFSCWICAFCAARTRFSTFKGARVRVSVRVRSELEALNDGSVRLDTLA